MRCRRRASCIQSSVTPGRRESTDRVYSDAQAARGQQLYKAQCVACHGEALEGAVGPPLAGTGSSRSGVHVRSPSSSTRSRRRCPRRRPAVCRGSRRSIWRRSSCALANFLPGRPNSASAALGQIAFPAARRLRRRHLPGASSFAVAGNLAQLMRGVTFPNANILFNVQVKDPAKEKPAMPMPFDYVLWGSTVYYGWQAVDQAALALVETAPLFLLPGRRCENGRPFRSIAPTGSSTPTALMDVGTSGLQGRATRDADAVEQGRRSAQRDVRELPQGLSRRREGRKHGGRHSMPMTCASPLQQRIEPCGVWRLGQMLVEASFERCLNI